MKRFERSNGLDTALYKTIPFYLFYESKRNINIVIESLHDVLASHLESFMT